MLNSGDIDGVITNRASLSFGPHSLWLYRDDYVVVKAHSFQEIKFQVGGGNDDASLEAWKLAVIETKPLDFTVVIRSNRTYTVGRGSLGD